MKPLLLFSIITLTAIITFYTVDEVFAAGEEPCKARCRAAIIDETPAINGNKVTMKVPDLTSTGTRTSNNCDGQIVVVANWTRFEDGRWIELGMTQGLVDNNDDGRTDECLTTETLYYAYCEDGNLPGDVDYDPSEGVCDGGDYNEIIFARDIPVNAEYEFEILRSPTNPDNWNISVRPFSEFAIASVFLPNVVTGESVQIGIENTVEAFLTPSISSVHVKDPQRNTGVTGYRDWDRNEVLVSQIVTNPFNQYLEHHTEPCRNNRYDHVHFGVGHNIDCSERDILLNNGPVPVSSAITVKPNETVTFEVESVDLNGDELRFFIEEFPDFGTITHSIFNGVPLPNTTPTKAEIIYTAPSVEIADKFSYKVTDGFKMTEPFEFDVIVTAPRPSQPDPPQVTTVSPNSVTISWVAPPSEDPITSFEIQRKNHSQDDSGYFTVDNIQVTVGAPPSPDEPSPAPLSAYSYEDTTVQPNNVYDYRIRASTSFGFGDYSEVITVSTAPERSVPFNAPPREAYLPIPPGPFD